MILNTLKVDQALGRCPSFHAVPVRQAAGPNLRQRSFTAHLDRQDVPARTMDVEIRAEVELQAYRLALEGRHIKAIGRQAVSPGETLLALGAVAPTAIRAKAAEDILRGKKLEDKVIEEAAEAAMGESRPISDIRSSAEDRKNMVGVLTRRAVKQAWERAKTS